MVCSIFICLNCIFTNFVWSLVGLVMVYVFFYASKVSVFLGLRKKYFF